MEDVEIFATFDTEETAHSVTRSLNAWFHWLVEGNYDDMPELFEDFGVATDDYALDRDSEVDWQEPPVAEANGNRVRVSAEAGETTTLIPELLENLGAYDVVDGEDADEALD